MESLCDVGSERAVLAGLITYGYGIYLEVADIINPNVFSVESNQIIYKSLVKFFEDCVSEDSKPDIASIYAAANDISLGKHFDDIDEKKYLKSVANFVVNKDSVRKLAKRLRTLQVTKELTAVMEESKSELLSVTGEEKISSILSIPESKVLEFANRLMGYDEGSSKLSEGLREFVQNIFDNPNKSVGISSGMPIYDRAIGGGFRRGSVNIIGARPKIGKTTLGINVCLHSCRTLKIPVLYFDMEMQKEDFWTKILSNLSGIEINQIEKGELNDQEKSRIITAEKVMNDLEFHYCNISGKSFEETLSLASRNILKKVGRDTSGRINDCLMVYDYLRLNNSENITNNIQEYQALGFQIISLKNFALRHDIPMLTFVQLNRDGINKEDTDVVSGSDRIIWLCNNFSIFKPREEEEIAEDIAANRPVTARKINVIVTRHGEGLPTPNDYIGINFDGKLARIHEGKTRGQMLKAKKEFETKATEDDYNFTDPKPGRTESHQ